MGWKAEIWEGRWVLRRWVTGVLFAVVSSEHKVGKKDSPLPNPYRHSLQPPTLKQRKQLTRNSSCKSPSSHHVYPGTPSGSRGLLAGLAIPWLCARWLGFWRARLPAPRLGGSRCGRGCRCLCRWTGRRAFRRTCSFGVHLGVVVRLGLWDLGMWTRLSWSIEERSLSFSLLETDYGCMCSEVGNWNRHVQSVPSISKTIPCSAGAPSVPA